MMISTEAFHAAVENVKRQAMGIRWNTTRADALKWHIMLALEGAEPELRKADQEILGRIGELAAKRQPVARAYPDEYNRGYDRALADVLEILGQVTP
jgi:hypothetical protein